MIKSSNNYNNVFTTSSSKSKMPLLFQTNETKSIFYDEKSHKRQTLGQKSKCEIMSTSSIEHCTQPYPSQKTKNSQKKTPKKKRKSNVKKFNGGGLPGHGAEKLPNDFWKFLWVADDSGAKPTILLHQQFIDGHEN